jgi:hypothetical protein
MMACEAACAWREGSTGAWKAVEMPVRAIPLVAAGQPHKSKGISIIHDDFIEMV